MRRSAIKTWFLVHKWTSLICTAFLLMLCVTGLPLIFHDELDALSDVGGAVVGPASSGTDPSLIPLDRILATALAARPGQVPLFMAFDNNGPTLTVTTGPTPDAAPSDMSLQLFDRTTGRAIGAEQAGGVMDFILQLHTDMFLGLPGMLLLGLMGLLFLIATGSGVVLYAPFMRRLGFGTLRVARSTRLKWIDWHNLLGIVGLAWACVVGLTGVINTLATPIVKYWQASELADMTRAYSDKPALPPARYGSLDTAMAAVRPARPGTNPQFIAFPGGSFSSKHHYAVFLQGDTPLTERILTPALVDAETGRLTDMRILPWYVQALLFSQPLHFGDYGGLPMKILWAVLDFVTLVVLASGLYLWVGRRRATVKEHVREVESGGTVAPALP